MKNFLLKKGIALLIIFVILFTSTICCFANSKLTTDVFALDNYTQYRLDFSKQRTSEDLTSEETINQAIMYVESLGLDDIGYAHIEEACLSELNNYREDDIVLESYTVLVPKNRAKTYFGTYNGYQFYYDYTSLADMRRETDGAKKGLLNSSKWKNWILATTDLILTFVDTEWSLAYSLIRTITGAVDVEPSDVKYGSYNQYVEQFTNLRTRSVYRLNGNSYHLCYQDQSANYRVQMYFCPVGDKFAYDYYPIKTFTHGAINANDKTTSEIMQQANVYANHNSKVVWTVTSNRISEDWV